MKPATFTLVYCRTLVATTLLCLATQLGAADFSGKFAIVMIDDRTEAKLGEFPFDRGVIAKGIDACTEAGAKAVVLKFFFDQPRSATGDAALAKAMHRIPVALQARLEQSEGTTIRIPERFGFGQEKPMTEMHGDKAWVPLPEFMDAAAAIGFVDFGDTAVPLVEAYQGVAYKSLVVTCLELALDSAAKIEPGRIRFGKRFLPVATANVFQADLRTGGPMPIVSFLDLLSGNFPRAEIKDRVVILGWDSPRTPTVGTDVGPMRIHRFFVECVAAAYRKLKDE